MSLHPVHDTEAIAEVLKAASLPDLCTELARRAQSCYDMGADCGRFAAAEDDPRRSESFRDMGLAFVAKGDMYGRMAKEGRGK